MKNVLSEQLNSNVSLLIMIIASVTEKKNGSAFVKFRLEPCVTTDISDTVGTVER